MDTCEIVYPYGGSKHCVYWFPFPAHVMVVVHWELDAFRGPLMAAESLNRFLRDGRTVEYYIEEVPAPLRHLDPPEIKLDLTSGSHDETFDASFLLPGDKSIAVKMTKTRSDGSREDVTGPFTVDFTILAWDDPQCLLLAQKQAGQKGPAAKSKNSARKK
jgi:hypothetical protein